MENCAQGKWSLHSRWNFISTFTELHVHGDERWPMQVTSKTYFCGVNKKSFCCSPVNLAVRHKRTLFRVSDFLVSESDIQHCAIVKLFPDDHHTDGQSPRETRVDGQSGVASEVEGARVLQIQISQTQVIWRKWNHKIMQLLRPLLNKMHVMN